MTTNLNDDFIKKAFLQDIKALSEKAKTKGVTAYLEPTRRPTLRPNERFLRNTIASVEQSNKRAQESEMWSRRKSQLQREEGGDTRHSSGPSSEGDGEQEGPRKRQRHSKNDDLGLTGANHKESSLGGKSDEELERYLEQRPKVRGRGGSGPRIGLTGPYLEDHEAGKSIREAEGGVLRREMGPSRPDWLQGAGGASGDGGRHKSRSKEESSSSSSGDSEKERRKKKEKKEKRKKKEKKREKERKKKRRDKEKG